MPSTTTGLLVLRFAPFLLILAAVGCGPVRTAAEDAAAPAATAAPSVAASRALDVFVEREDPAFAWELINEIDTAAAKAFQLELTSQRWNDEPWQHVLMVYEPAEVVHEQQMLLFVTGGVTGRLPGPGDFALGLKLAELCGGRVAVLHQVPNQPLLGGRYEDDLITETWLKYLKDGDADWPLLFPMVKSAVKAMDALEQFAESRAWPALDGFVVSGASKRGWTSWLTAAADPRILATAPMVIDMLNFPEQIRHQYKLWGKPSEQVRDYTGKGLIPRDGIPRPGLEANLWKMMDPYSYRDRVEMPKLLVVGANDRYWATDAMNLYWDQLEGDKYIFRGANAGHSLDGRRDEAMTTLGVFFRHVAAGKPLPQLTWDVQQKPDGLGLEIRSDTEPAESRFWVARSASLDFRDTQWQPKPLQNGEDSLIGRAESDGRHLAVFGELLFEYEGLTYSLATLAYCL